MKYSLFVSDLHFTSAPRDAYRFGIFDRLHQEINQRRVYEVWILGDLTESKDSHSALLVNKITDCVAALAKRVEVKILRGNHDGLSADCPFFYFLNHFGGQVKFYVKPEEYVLMPCDKSVCLLPHSRDPLKDWKRFKLKDKDFVLMHATVEGAIAENGMTLNGGIPTDWFKIKGKVYSGDVHVPQKIGKITYIGAPYPIRFGDSFQPRMLYLDGNFQELEIPLDGGMKRLMADIANLAGLDTLDWHKGDQIKVRLHLPETDLGKWPKLRTQVSQWCTERGLDLAGIELVCERSQRSVMRTKAMAGIDPETVLDRYIDRHRVPEAVARIGKELLGSTPPTTGRAA